MSDQQQENEITTTQAAPAAPVASDQVAAPAQASAPETPKAASTPTPAAAEKAVPATGEELLRPKPKRTRARPGLPLTARRSPSPSAVPRARRTPSAPLQLTPRRRFPMRSHRHVRWRRLARLRWCAPAVVLPSARPRSDRACSSVCARDPCRRPADREAGTAHTPPHGC